MFERGAKDAPELAGFVAYLTALRRGHDALRRTEYLSGAADLATIVDSVEARIRHRATVLDADALTLIARDPGLVDGRTAPTLLTPHAGEFARLTGTELGSDRLTAVSGLAARWGVTVLLKGRVTLVADPTGHVLGNDAGSSWAATAVR